MNGLRPIRVLLLGAVVRWFGVSFYGLFLLPFFHAALGLSYAVAGLYIAAIGLVTLPVGQVGGGISDRFGRRRTIVVSLSGEAVGLAILAWGFAIPSIAVVLGALLLSRSFGVVGFSAAFAYVADSMDTTVRARGFSWLRVALNLGAFGGVALGGVLLTFVAYGQLTALAAIMVGAAAVVNGFWLTPTQRDRSLPAGASASSLVASPQELRGTRWVGLTIYSSFRPIWHDRALFMLISASVLIWLMVNQVFYAIPAFGLTYLGIPYGVLGVALSLTGLIPVLTQVQFTSALSGRRHTRIGIWGALTYAGSFLALGLDAVTRWAIIPFFFVFMVVTTLGENLIFLPVFTLPLNIASADSRGAYSGTITTAAGVAGIFLPLVAGIALTYASDPLVTWGILAAPAIPAIAILWHLDSRLPREANRI
jgi:MFS family permease